jgi:hypothetical protein
MPATRWIRAQLYSVVTSTLVCDSNYTALCRVRNWGKGTSHRHQFMRTRKGNRSSSFGEDEICANEFRPGCDVRIGTQPRARSGCSVSILRRTKVFSVIGRARARSRPHELANSSPCVPTRVCGAIKTLWCQTRNTNNSNSSWVSRTPGPEALRKRHQDQCGNRRQRECSGFKQCF